MLQNNNEVLQLSRMEAWRRGVYDVERSTENMLRGLQEDR
jgi:hypothetical protein